MATAKTTTAKKAAPMPVEHTIEKPTAPIKKKDTWVYKDRLYEISNGKKPLVYTVPTKVLDTSANYVTLQIKNHRL